MANWKNIKGGKELNDALMTLAPKIERNILRSGLRSAGQVMRDAIKAGVPVRLGNLRDSYKLSVRAKGGRVTASIKTYVFYALMVERGTAEHEIRPKHAKSLFLAGVARNLVKHPGSMEKPHVRPAIDGSGTEAVQAFVNQVRKRLTKQGLNTPDVDVTDE